MRSRTTENLRRPAYLVSQASVPLGGSRIIRKSAADWLKTTRAEVPEQISAETALIQR